MSYKEYMDERFETLLSVGQNAQADFSNKLHRQHYDFAHKLLPNLVSNYFPELINKIVDNSIQDWISQLWSDCADDSFLNYCTAVYPMCKFIKPSDEIGLIYFTMPAPRINPEAAYTAIVFLMDNESPSEWLRNYFTLELGTFIVPSVHWTFGEWDDLEHINRGRFTLEPTLNNFLTTVILEGQNRWS